MTIETLLSQSNPSTNLAPGQKYKLRVLLVEDEMVNKFVCQGMLKKLGCQVDQADNGKIAVEIMQTNSAHYDLIFMDCEMPIMDGYEATREIRKLELNGNKRIPIIACTANNRAEDRIKCFDAGMDDYISKPLYSTVMAEKLVKWVRV